MSADRAHPPGVAGGSILDPDEPWSGWVSGPTIAGVRWTPLPRLADQRGWFAKVYQRSDAPDGGADAVGEVYLSGSAQGVVRGMHFQSPPRDHTKSVSCIAGAVLDAIVDLRAGSPTENDVTTIRLDAACPGRLWLPRGVAHGFQALVDDTVLSYVVSTEHAPEHDHGVHHASVGIFWPIAPVVVSDRDAALPPLAKFESPFDSEPVEEPAP